MRRLQREGLFDAEQLVDDIKQLGHSASRATVYRTLNHLQDSGVCKQVFFDNKQSYFEVIAGGRQRHDYSNQCRNRAGRELQQRQAQSAAR